MRQSHALPVFRPAAPAAFAVSYSLFNETFLAPSNVASNTITRAAASHRTRRFSSVISHEVTHLLLAKRFGLVRDFWASTWKKEGFCEYVAGDTTLSWQEGLQLLKEGREDQSGPARYYSYYAAMKYLIDVKGDRIERIFANDYPVKNPQALRAELIPAVQP